MPASRPLRSLALPLFFALACDVGSSSEPGSTPGGGTGGEAKGTFDLVYRDDFEELNLARWQLMTHSWDGNLALFSAQTVSAIDGRLQIRLEPAPPGSADSAGVAKTFLGAEVRSRDTLTYGKVRARAKFAHGSAVVSSLVTIYTPWPADDWNELDVEYLGAGKSNIQFNTMVYTGAPTQKPVTQSVSPTQEPHLEDLGFDPSADFHVYTVEWTPESARFLVDEQLKYTWTKNIARMKLPQNVLLTIWASGSAGWAGAVDEKTGQASAEYDWVELYQYQEP